MKEQQNKTGDGRANDALHEMDVLIQTLQRVQQILVDSERATTVDLRHIISHAQSVRDLIQSEPSISRWGRVRECIAYLTMIADRIHSIIDCLFSQAIAHECWVNHKAA